MCYLFLYLCARVTLDVGACVRKTLCASLVERFDRRTLCSKAPKTRVSQSPSAFDSSQLLSVFIFLPLSLSLCACSSYALRPQNFDDLLVETDLSRLFPSFLDSLDTFWFLQYRSRNAPWWLARIVVFAARSIFFFSFYFCMNIGSLP